MRYRVLASVGILAVVIALMLIVPATLAGQAPKPPRTAWGAPDLQGVWDFRTLTPFERPSGLAGKQVLTDEEAADFVQEQNRLQNRDLVDSKKGGAGYPPESQGGVVPYNEFWYDRGSTVVGTRRTSLIIDPPDGRLPPLTPEAQKRAASPEAKRLEAANLNADSSEDLGPGSRCIQHGKAGPPINPGAYNNNIELLQTPGYVAILNEQIHDTRLIPLDGRPHVGPQIRQWLGDSRGRWEGDTLIVETTNFNGKHDQVGRPRLSGSEHLSLVERFTRVDADTLLYEYTVTDPTIWVRPWTAQFPMKKNPDKIYEYACHEGNYSLPVRLSGARAIQKAAAEAAKKGSK